MTTRINRCTFRILFLAFLCSIPAWATWSLIAHTSCTPSGTSGCTTGNINASGGTLIIINVEGIVPFSVSDSQSNMYTSAVVNSGHGTDNQLFYKASPTVTSSMNFTASALVGSLQVQVWSGVDTSDPLDQTSNNNNSGVNTECLPGALTAALNGSLYVTGISGQNTQTFTIDSSFTISDQFSGSGFAVPGGMGYFVQMTAASLNPKWSDGSGTAKACTMATFNPAPVSVGPQHKVTSQN